MYQRIAVARARRETYIGPWLPEPVDTSADPFLGAERGEALVAAAQQGDLQRLEELLADDVISYTDGNGMRGAFRIPVYGRPTVARFLRAFAPHFWRDTSLHWIEANGQPSVLISRDGTEVALLAVSASAAGINRLMWVLSPDKLSGVSVTPG